MGENSPGGNLLGGNSPGGNFLGGNFLGGNFLDGNSLGGIHLVPANLPQMETMLLDVRRQHQNNINIT